MAKAPERPLGVSDEAGDPLRLVVSRELARSNTVVLSEPAPGDL
jgi:hypothetical protein